MVTIIDKNSKGFCEAAQRAAAYMPIVQQVSEDVYEVQSETDPYHYYTVEIYGDKADCDCRCGQHGNGTKICKHIPSAVAWKELHAATPRMCCECEVLAALPNLDICQNCLDAQQVNEWEVARAKATAYTEPVQQDFCKIMFVDTVWIVAYLVGNPAGECKVEAKIYSRKTQSWVDVAMTVEEYVEQIDLNSFQLAMAVKTFDAKVSENDRMWDLAAAWLEKRGY